MIHLDRYTRDRLLRQAARPLDDDGQVQVDRDDLGTLLAAVEDGVDLDTAGQSVVRAFNSLCEAAA